MTIDFIKMWFSFCRYQVMAAILCLGLTPYVWNTGWICAIILVLAPSIDFYNLCKDLYNGK